METTTKDMTISTDTLNPNRSYAELKSFIETSQAFMRLMGDYECAIMEIETKLKVLNLEFSRLHSRNPFEYISSRLKKPVSIMGKMERKGYEPTIENIEKNLFDIAGIRVICSFVEDIYILENLLINQDDITLVQRKDYIKNPKENGYRSLHLILDIPIFLSNEKKHMKVEVQFRTIAMDFWASLEHKLKYKKEINDVEEIASDLKECATSISQIDQRMEDILHRIEKQK